MSSIAQEALSEFLRNSIFGFLRELISEVIGKIRIGVYAVTIMPRVDLVLAIAATVDLCLK